MNNQINKILSTCKNVAIIGHIKPDGDCFGSISGVNDYINDKFNCTIHCFGDCDNIAEEFECFVKDLVFNPTPLAHYDSCICVDTGDLNRLGKYVDVFNNSCTTICIDHHATNPGFANINIVTNRSSNCENIYYLLKEIGFPARKSTLAKICAGILTDTLNLSTDSVTEQTFLAIAEIKQAGVDVYRLQKYFFGGNSLVQFNLLAKAMSSAKFYNNNTIAVMEITQEQMDDIGATKEDFSSIIGQAFCLRNSFAALLISPREEKIHVSLRAKKGLDVSVIATHFGGGGHKAASAFTTENLTDSNLQYVIKQLTNQINNLPKENKNIFD